MRCKSASQTRSGINQVGVSPLKFLALISLLANFCWAGEIPIARRVYSYEQTIAYVITNDDNDEGLYCALFERRFKDALPQELKEMPWIEVGYGDMQRLIEFCDGMEDQKSWLKKARDTVIQQIQRFSPLNNIIILKIMKSAVRKIIPDTKWCGTGNTAANFADLGKEAAVDRCCRMHDFCPVTVPANSTAYGLRNDGKYTYSHCSCDSAFFDCLQGKKWQHNLAESVGIAFFGVGRLKCIDGWPTGPPESDKPYESMRLSDMTQQWTPNPLLTYPSYVNMFLP